LTATADGATASSQTVTVIAGATAAIAVSPGQVAIRARDAQRLAAVATDAFGNDTGATVTWRVRPAALGRVERTAAGAATFTAGRELRAGTITASSGAVSGSAVLRVVAGTVRIHPISFRPGGGSLRIFVTTVDQGRRPVSGTSVRVAVRLDGRRIAVVRGRTGAAGRTMLRTAFTRGCVVVTVTRAAAQGFRWDGRTPRNRVCR
jgi:hypothetical protein